MLRSDSFRPPARASRWPWILAVLGGALALGVFIHQSGMYPGSGSTAQRLEHVRQTAEKRISRISCESCPPSWTMRDCDFAVEYANLGTGAQAATCQRLDPSVGIRRSPEESDKDAVDRVGEAGTHAARDPNGWVAVYIFGYDLERTAVPQVQLTGQIARSYALQKLATLPPSAESTWPADLVRFLVGTVNRRHHLDAAILYTATLLPSPTFPWKVRTLERLLERAEDIDPGDAAAVAAFYADFPSWAPANLLGVEALVKESEIERETWSIALAGAVATYRERTGACPTLPTDLVPTLLPELPEGDSFSLPDCERKAEPKGSELAGSQAG